MTELQYPIILNGQGVEPIAFVLVYFIFSDSGHLGYFTIFVESLFLKQILVEIFIVLGSSKYSIEMIKGQV